MARNKGFSASLSKIEKTAAAKYLKRSRQSLGNTIYEFADVAGVSEQTVKHWERGINAISVVTAFQLYRKSRGVCRVEMMRPDFIKFLREFKDVIDDLKI